MPAFRNAQTAGGGLLPSALLPATFVAQAFDAGVRRIAPPRVAVARGCCCGVRFAAVEPAEMSQRR
jgi:hypothetical protein